MHAIAEVVIPPTGDVRVAVGQVMDYFRGDPDEEGGERPSADWWDFWVVGGRFSGHKIETRIGREKLAAFHNLLNERKVTVSGLRCGKPDLSPATQIPEIDALWRQWFPGMGDKCLLFNHARSQYGDDGIAPDDVCTVAEIPDGLTCERLILAKPHWDDPTRLEAGEMLVTEFWNRCTHQKTDFGGDVKEGLRSMVERINRVYRPGYFEETYPGFDRWRVVTVDYHN
jgi:hypothetical protein